MRKNGREAVCVLERLEGGRLLFKLADARTDNVDIVDVAGMDIADIGQIQPMSG